MTTFALVRRGLGVTMKELSWRCSLPVLNLDSQPDPGGKLCIFGTRLNSGTVDV
jgi:hypothetical protein